MAEGEGEAAEETKKGKKGLIIKIVPLVLVALVVAKMTVLKPPPLTAQQKADKIAAAAKALKEKCAEANGIELKEEDTADKKDEKSDGSTTTTIAAPAPAEEGPVLTMDSVTVNLADNHFLKVGVGLSLPPKTVIEELKTNNFGTPALNYVITKLRTKTTDQIGAKDLEPLRQQLGMDVCMSDGSAKYQGMNYQGKVLTIFFSDFVSQ